MTAAAEEPSYPIDYNLPIDFKLSYEDFADPLPAEPWLQARHEMEIRSSR